MAFVISNASVPRQLNGLIARAVTSTTLAITAGSARDSSNSKDLAITSSSTLDITTLGALGFDSPTSAATGTVSGGGLTVTATASVVSELQTRAGLGTGITTAGATVTGFGTKWISGIDTTPGRLGELAVGDLIGNATKGWARVTQILSDTSANIAAALPGGDIGVSAAYTIIENATVRVGANIAANNQLINTLSAAGTVIVVASALTAAGAGNALVFGVVPVVTTPIWMYLWVRSGTSGVTIMASMQRTTPFPNANFNSVSRRFGSWPVGLISGTLGLSHGQQHEVSNLARRWSFFGPVGAGGYNDAASAVVTNISNQVLAAFVVPMAPPTSRRAEVAVQTTNNGSAGGTGVCSMNIGDGTLSGILQLIYEGFVGLIPVDARQFVSLSVTNTGGNSQTMSVNCVGFEEVL